MAFSSFHFLSLKKYTYTHISLHTHTSCLSLSIAVRRRRRRRIRKDQRRKKKRKEKEAIFSLSLKFLRPSDCFLIQSMALCKFWILELLSFIALLFVHCFIDYKLCYTFSMLCLLIKKEYGTIV